MKLREIILWDWVYPLAFIALVVAYLRLAWYVGWFPW